MASNPSVPWWLPSEYSDIDWKTPENAQWDTITLGHVEYSGVISVKGKGKYDLDPKKPKNMSAARLEFGGYQPFDITITLQMFTEEQWAIVVNDLVPLLRPVNDTAIPKAVSVAHPALRSVGVHSIVVKSITMPDTDDAKEGKNQAQIKKFVVECYEYIPIEWKREEKQSGASDNIIKGSKPLGIVDHKFKEFNSNIPNPPSSGKLQLNGGQTPQSLYAKAKKKKAAVTPTEPAPESPGTPLEPI